MKLKLIRTGVKHGLKPEPQLYLSTEYLSSDNLNGTDESNKDSVFTIE